MDPGGRELVEMDDCLGTGVTITAVGQPDVRMTGQVCAAEVLRIQEDHTAFVEAMFG